MSNSPEEIIARLATYLAENLEQAPSSPISAETRLVTDLNLDSIQSFEMVADLEDHYEVSIPMEEMQDLETVGDLAAAVVKLLPAS